MRTASDVLGAPGSVPSTCGVCGTAVQLSQVAVDAVRGFNVQLAKQGDAPLTLADVSRCPPCRREWQRSMEWALIRSMERRRGTWGSVPE